MFPLAEFFPPLLLVSILEGRAVFLTCGIFLCLGKGLEAPGISVSAETTPAFWLPHRWEWLGQGLSERGLSGGTAGSRRWAKGDVSSLDGCFS